MDRSNLAPLLCRYAASDRRRHDRLAQRLANDSRDVSGSDVRLVTERCAIWRHPQISNHPRQSKFRLPGPRELTRKHRSVSRRQTDPMGLRTLVRKPIGSVEVN